MARRSELCGMVCQGKCIDVHGGSIYINRDLGEVVAQEMENFFYNMSICLKFLDRARAKNQ